MAIYSQSLAYNPGSTIGPTNAADDLNIHVGHVNCGTSNGMFCIRNTNALELKWTLPTGVSVPDDNTWATISCETNYDATKDVLNIYSQSVVTEGFGTANCWYSKVSKGAGLGYTHYITCKNTGALASGSKHSVAF